MWVLVVAAQYLKEKTIQEHALSFAKLCNSHINYQQDQSKMPDNEGSNIVSEAGQSNKCQWCKDNCTIL